jgi:serine/threonine protein kinase
LEELGTLLPAYSFDHLIAQGGMGAVYKARQKSLDRDVAIKILPPELGADAIFRRSFETEARAMARLNHPNLIAVYDSGEAGGLLYIVMEYVPGKSLYHSAYGMRVDPVQAAELMIGVCRGLAHAHEHGILHRDIKPANILLTPKTEPKIGDFGLAQPMGAEGAGLVMGTAGYTAPEVMRDPGSADHRADLYAVGVILYELLTGERQRPDSFPPSVLGAGDSELDQIWQRATNPNPGMRYPDGHAFASDLVMWMKRQPMKIDHTHLRPATHTAPPLRRPAARQTAPAVRRRSPFGKILRLLLLAGLVVAGHYVWKHPELLGKARAALSGAAP